MISIMKFTKVMERINYTQGHFTKFYSFWHGSHIELHRQFYSFYDDKFYILLCICAHNMLSVLYSTSLQSYSHYCIVLKLPHGKILLEEKEMMLLMTNTAILMINTLNMLICVHLQYSKQMHQSNIHKRNRISLHV